MPEQRFGDVLRRFVPISRHDIEEVLQEQAGEGRRRRFGEIALSLGLCRPEHVWQAWCFQLSQHSQKVKLRDLGIDSQATIYMTPAMAREYHVVPLRLFEDQIIIAVDDASRERAVRELPRLLDMHVRWVTADATEIDTAIAAYFPVNPKPAGRAA